MASKLILLTVKLCSTYSLNLGPSALFCNEAYMSPGPIKSVQNYRLKVPHSGYSTCSTPLVPPKSVQNYRLKVPHSRYSTCSSPLVPPKSVQNYRLKVWSIAFQLILIMLECIIFARPPPPFPHFPPFFGRNPGKIVFYSTPTALRTGILVCTAVRGPITLHQSTITYWFVYYV